MMDGVGRPVAVLTAATLLTAVYGVTADSPFTWIYVTITVVLAALVGVIHAFTPLSRRAAWALVAAAIINLVGGVLLVEGQPLYVLALWGDFRFDKPAHLVATGLAALAVFDVVAPRLDRATNLTTARILAVLVACGLGALVEIVEFVGTLVVENANVGDYGNNMADLVANLAGAILAMPLMRFGPDRAPFKDPT